MPIGGMLNLSLVCGGSKDKGIVEIFAEMQWLKACNDSWTDFETKLVCRELGLKNSSTGT